ncbi:MAG: class I SAM-dependent methyltransferase [Rhodocyclaceae bacterium]|nr:class I SAM-dependent methyltransferase [Rhodocyclaceae bacterium]
MSTQTNPIIQQIEDAVRDVPGWSPLDQLFALFNLAYASAPLGGDVLELGSWCGRSAVALGLAARLSGGVAHCVDLFPEKEDWYRNADGSYSMRVTVDGRCISSYDEQTVWAEPFERDIAPLYAAHGSLQARFQKTIEDSRLVQQVQAFRGDLHAFFNLHPALCLRLAFLDGHHSHAAVCEDIDRVMPHLLPGAWLCFDDAFTSYEGVNQAIREKVLDSEHFDMAQQLTRKLFVARRRG